MPSNELEGLFFLLQRGRILRERFTLNILIYSEISNKRLLVSLLFYKQIL